MTPDEVGRAARRKQPLLARRGRLLFLQSAGISAHGAVECRRAKSRGGWQRGEKVSP